MKVYKIEFTVYEHESPTCGGSFNIMAKNKKHAEKKCLNQIEEVYKVNLDEPKYITEMEFIK